MNDVSKISLLALVLAIPACAAGTEEEADFGPDATPVGVVTQAVTDVCTPVLRGAAITSQRTQGFGTPAWKYPAKITIELTTLSAKPFKMVANRFSATPPGIGLGGGSSSCVPDARNPSLYRCWTQVTAPVNLCTANGNYQIKFQAVADADSGCGNGQVPIDFSLTTENLCNETTVNGDQPLVAAIYPAADFGGGHQLLTEGWHDLGALTIGNDTLSSLSVAPGYKLTIFDHAGFQGAQQTFTGEVSYVGAWWNDRTSSILVERQ